MAAQGEHSYLIVIGSGPAGRRGRAATQLQKSVLVVERGRRVGGARERVRLDARLRAVACEVLAA